MYRLHVNINAMLLSIALLYTGATVAQQVVVTDSIQLSAQAHAFCFNELGETFVSINEEARILKITENGYIVEECGGFGWSPGLFDNPVSLAPGLLKIFVADKNNHRIQVFDRNLNLISVVTADGYPDFLPALRYPTSVALNKKGETFVLSEEQKSILKFDVSGIPEIVIGGNNYGKYRLANPSSIFTTSDNGVAVIDDTNLVLFDSFGTGVAIHPIKDSLVYGLDWQRQLYLLSAQSIIVFDASRDRKAYELPAQYAGILLAIGVKNRQLYGLTRNSILHLSLE